MYVVLILFGMQAFHMPCTDVEINPKTGCTHTKYVNTITIHHYPALGRKESVSRLGLKLDRPTVSIVKTSPIIVNNNNIIIKCRTKQMQKTSTVNLQRDKLKKLIN